MPKPLFQVAPSVIDLSMRLFFILNLLVPFIYWLNSAHIAFHPSMRSFSMPAFTPSSTLCIYPSWSILHLHPLHAFILHDPYWHLHPFHSFILHQFIFAYSPSPRFGLHENWGPVFVNWLYIQHLAYSNYRWQRLIKVIILLIRGPNCIMNWFIFQDPPLISYFL